MTWANAQENGGVLTIEDPLLGTATDKETFGRVYGPFLESLDGSDMVSFFDFFFVQSPICESYWVFRDHTARLDFQECCVEDGCLPPLKEVHTGESKEDKESRMKKEEEKKIKSLQNQKKKVKNLLSPEEKAEKRRLQMIATRQSLIESLKDPDLDEKTRSKLEKKLEKLNLSMDSIQRESK